MTAAEDRGVQVEARTLSGVHIGRRISGLDRGSPGRFDGLLVSVYHDEREDLIDLRVRERRLPGVVTVLPTDLVTLTDRGAPS